MAQTFSTIRFLIAGFFLVFIPSTLASPCCQRMDGDRDVPVDSRFPDQVKIREIIATLLVESAGAYFSGGANKYATSFRVLAKEKVDTLIYGNIYSRNPSLDTAEPPNDFDTAGFQNQHIDTMGHWNVKAGDTLRNIFVLEVESGGLSRQWHLTGIECKYKISTDSVYPIAPALAALKAHWDSLKINDGYRFVSNVLKLGPQFILARGDPGWLLTAKYDSAQWYFNLITGSGDCPAGCTEHVESIYKVNAVGKVSLVSSHVLTGLCLPSLPVRRTQKPGVSRARSKIFKADGRLWAKPSKTPGPEIHQKVFKKN